MPRRCYLSREFELKMLRGVVVDSGGKLFNTCLFLLSFTSSRCKFISGMSTLFITFLYGFASLLSACLFCYVC